GSSGATRVRPALADARVASFHRAALLVLRLPDQFPALVPLQRAPGGPADARIQPEPARGRDRLFDWPAHPVLGTHQYRRERRPAETSHHHAGLPPRPPLDRTQPDEFRHDVQSLGPPVWDLPRSREGPGGRAARPGRTVRQEENGEDAGGGVEGSPKEAGRKKSELQRPEQ